MIRYEVPLLIVHGGGGDPGSGGKELVLGDLDGFIFFQAEDGIRDLTVTGVQTCALPISFAGPGYLVAVGYMDPGNWATDLGGGSKFGYTLLSVILISNLMAMFLQALSAKLGIDRKSVV